MLFFTHFGWNISKSLKIGRHYSPKFFASRQARIEYAIQAGLENTAMSRRQYDALEAEIRKFCKSHLAPRNKDLFMKTMGNFFENINSNLQGDEEEMDEFDLEIYGQVDFLLQQGPHSAILACNMR